MSGLRGDDLRRILQIGIHDHDSMASGMFQASGHSHLMAKISGEGHDTHPGLSRLETLQKGKRAVPAAIIYVEDFKAARGFLIHQLYEPLMGLADHCFFVKAGKNNGAEREVLCWGGGAEGMAKAQNDEARETLENLLWAGSVF